MIQNPIDCAMLIRPASSPDAKLVSQILHSFSHTFTISPAGEGAEAFFETITERAILELIAQKNVVYLVAETPEGSIAGIAAMRDNRALIHLFVKTEYQRAGLGRKLWERLCADALRAGNRGEFTVNSSIGAVPVYQRFGFAIAGPRIEKHGGAYIPMTLRIARESVSSDRSLTEHSTRHTKD